MNYLNIQKEIVAAAKEQHKLLSEQIPAINMTANIEAWQSGKFQYYVFKFAGKEYKSDTQAFHEVTDFSLVIEEAIKELSQLRGYMVARHCTTVYHQVRDYVWGGYRSEPVEITDGIILYSAPTKEFTSMAKWVEKFSGTKIDIFTLYGVEISGKRGRIYGEDGDRRYDCYNKAKCRRILDWIIAKKSSRDTLKVEVRTTDEVPDRDIFIRIETECDGTRFSYLHMEVITPGGKVKANIDTIYI